MRKLATVIVTIAIGTFVLFSTIESLQTQISLLNLNTNFTNYKAIQKVTLTTAKRNTADVNHLLHTSVVVSVEGTLGAGTVVKKTDRTMYVLTCYHVVAAAITSQNTDQEKEIEVGYQRLDIDNNVAGRTVYVAEVVRGNKEIDLVLLKINVIDSALEVATISDTEPEKGDVIYTVGNPLGMMLTVSKGILANKIEYLYITDGTVTFGNSGGGLFNERGELIGVPSRIPGYVFGIPESGLGMSINLKTIREFLQGVDFNG